MELLGFRHFAVVSIVAIVSTNSGFSNELCPLLPTFGVLQTSFSEQATTRERFKLLVMGNLRATDNTPLGTRAYQSSAGERVELIYGRFSSSDKALNEFRVWLKGAKTVKEQEQLKDLAGNYVGERAIADYPGNEHAPRYALVCWVKDKNAYWVSSTSLAVALEFERRINTGSSLITGQATTK